MKNEREREKVIEGEREREKERFHVQLTPTLVKFIVRVKCGYSHYKIIKEKAAWGQMKILLEKGFCYRRSRWTGSPLYVEFTF